MNHVGTNDRGRRHVGLIYPVSRFVLLTTCYLYCARNYRGVPSLSRERPSYQLHDPGTPERRQKRSSAAHSFVMPYCTVSVNVTVWLIADAPEPDVPVTLIV
jgi:hypothetical protein